MKAKKIDFIKEFETIVDKKYNYKQDLNALSSNERNALLKQILAKNDVIVFGDDNE